LESDPNSCNFCVQRLRQHGHAVLAALAITHQHLAALKIDILDTQAHHLHQPHARAVQQAGHQAMRALHALQHSGHFRGGQHHRQTGRPLGAHHVLHPGQVLAQYLTIQKQQG
jgi:hypothetical protein